ncbi:MAG: sulfotransferase family protein, partial [Aquisalinus sp.]|nr:sulfotransferase family protein [Aquisalinus sp.]
MPVSQGASLGEIKKEVAKFMTWREFNYNCHISLKHRFAYFETPKVGCSSIKYAMMHLELEGFSPRITDPHLTFYNMPTVKPYQLDTAHLYDVLFTDRFFRFSFVRNPFTRTLSAYLDKIKRPKRLAGSISRALGLMPGASTDMTFGEFLDFIIRTPAFQQDKHWRPQNQVLLYGLIEFH